jgi:hypothetical protein
MAIRIKIGAEQWPSAVREDAIAIVLAKVADASPAATIPKAVIAAVMELLVVEE